MNRMNKFLSDNNIINAPSNRDKSSLERGNKITNDRTNHVNNNLGHNLIDNIAQANRPKLSKGFSPKTFRNQRDQKSY